MDQQQIERALLGSGLIFRGGFLPEPDDGLDESIQAVVLIGNAGPEMWRVFSKASEFALEKDPLDIWSRRVISGIAGRLGADALYPFDGPPYFPFQRWAMKAEQVWSSPIGPLIHPEYGLWHAYRGVLLFRREIKFSSRPADASPCQSCADKPCLTHCPVNAFKPGKYDVPACARHLKSPAGEGCKKGGCIARASCPIGRPYVYEADHAQFHMFHFLKNHS
jgi:hypothetical protein